MTGPNIGDEKADALLAAAKRQRAEQRAEIRTLIHKVNSIDAQRAAQARAQTRRTR